MDKIKKLSLEEYDEFFRISANAYPGVPYKYDESEKRFKSIQDEIPTIDFYGLYRDNELLAVLRMHDFSMNLRGARIPIGGLGGVAVDLLHKKERVAKSLVELYEKHFLERDYPMTILYPFRPDFYYKMGYGYGAQIMQFKLDPKALPTGCGKDKLRFLTLDDSDNLDEFLQRFTNTTHGMILKYSREYEGLLKQKACKLIGYFEDEKIKGLMLFTFEKAHKDNMICNDLEIIELMYSDHKVFSAFCQFLRTQADQVRRLIFSTTNPELYHIFSDLSYGEDNMMRPVYHETAHTGIGLMYKITDLGMLIPMLADAKFGLGNLILQIKSEDTLLEKSYDLTVEFQNGSISLTDKKPEAVLEGDIAVLSSIFMGTLSLKNAVFYQQATLSDVAYLETLHNIFRTDKQVVCYSSF